MSESPMRDEAIREVFQSRAESSRGTCSEDDLERIWLAASGRLAASERRALVERMATDPALAEAWRVATDLWRASQGGADAEVEAERTGPRWWTWSPSWLAAAAVLVLAVGGAFVFWPEPGGDELREQTSVTIESLIPADATVPRDAFQLRWTAGPEGSRYQVRVTTEDLRVIATGADLAMPELVVMPGQLGEVAPGSRVLWQVDVILPDGSKVSSQTFVVMVR